MPLPGRAELYAAVSRSVLVAALAGAALAVPAGAQEAGGIVLAGTLSGTLEDLRAQPAEAALELESVQTGLRTRVTPAANGTFLLPHLAPGVYRLRQMGAAAGETVEVGAGETVTLRLVLDDAGLTLAGERHAAALASDVLEAATPVEPDQNADGLVSAGGLPATEGALTLDGAALTQGFSGVAAGAGTEAATDPDDDADTAERTTGPTHGLGRGRRAGAAYLFAQGSVREFRTGTGGYAPAGEERAGAVTAVATRGGGRRFHGAGFFQVRSSALAAYDPDAVATSYTSTAAGGVVSTVAVKPHDLRERFGGSVGGPLAESRRLYFLYAFDGQRRGFPAISSPADPLFYALTANQRALLGNRGVTVAATDKALAYLSSLTGTVARRADQTIHFGRLDWLEHARAQLGLEGSRVSWSSPAGLQDAPVIARGRASLGNAAGTVELGIARLTTAISPRTVNQLAGSFVRDVQYETAQTPLAQEPAVAAGGQAPQVTIGPNGLLFGTPATLAQGAQPDERRAGFTEALTLVRGRHSVQFGGSASFLQERAEALTNGAGSFRYDSTSNGAGGITDFITDYTFNVNAYPNGGCPSIYATVHLFCFRSYTQSFGPARQQFSTADFSAFAQDSWRVSRRLQVVAGVRFAYTLLPLPQAPNAALDAVFSARGASSIFPEDRNNFGPRLSFAWRPPGLTGTTVRAGYGVFFGRLPGATISHALSDTAMTASGSASTTRVRIRPATELTCDSTGAQGFGYPCSLTAVPTGVRAQAANAVVFARGFRLPAIQQGSLLVEQELGLSTTVSAAYVINVDRQLGGSVDLNVAPATGMATVLLEGGTGVPGVRGGESFAVPLYTARVTTAFGPVTAITSHANGSYNALVLAGETRALPGVLLRGGYTWSKAIDNGPNLSGIPRTSTQFDPFQNGYDKGLSSLNYPWTARMEAVWTPHVDSASRVVRGLLNGFVLTPLASGRAGRPYSFDLAGGTALAGGHESLNGSGGALYLPTVGRNTLRLPATVRADLRVARGFGAGRVAGEPARVQVFAEAFNVVNHRNVSSVNQRAYVQGAAVNGVVPLVFQSAAAIAAEGLNTTAFGTVNAASTSTARERQVELGVLFSF